MRPPGSISLSTNEVLDKLQGRGTSDRVKIWKLEWESYPKSPRGLWEREQEAKKKAAKLAARSQDEIEEDEEWAKCAKEARENGVDDEWGSEPESEPRRYKLYQDQTMANLNRSMCHLQMKEKENSNSAEMANDCDWAITGARPKVRKTNAPEKESMIKTKEETSDSWGSDTDTGIFVGSDQGEDHKMKKTLKRVHFGSDVQEECEADEDEKSCDRGGRTVRLTETEFLNIKRRFTKPDKVKKNQISVCGVLKNDQRKKN